MGGVASLRATCEHETRAARQRASERRRAIPPSRKDTGEAGLVKSAPSSQAQETADALQRTRRLRYLEEQAQCQVGDAENAEHHRRAEERRETARAQTGHGELHCESYTTCGDRGAPQAPEEPTGHTRAPHPRADPAAE